jgi:hypothetical protein
MAVRVAATSRSDHVVTPMPVMFSVPADPVAVSRMSPRTAIRTPPSSATATTNGGIAVSDVPNAPLSASSTAARPRPSSTSRQMRVRRSGAMSASISTTAPRVAITYGAPGA